MAEPLKNIYNDVFFAELETALQKAIPEIDTRKFIAAVKNPAWPGLELKQRMRQLSTTLHDHLTGSYKSKLPRLLKLVAALPTHSKVSYTGLAYMYLPDFIAQYGLQEMELSLKAMEKINRITSCEFAIRPFLLADEKRVMKQMLAWSRHPHQNIRRFASEGCRPRLPWGTAIPSLKKDPSSILPILENLKEDTAVYVQKSVANNLNDISKDHQDLVVSLAKKWMGKSAVTDWIIKHGCRGLLKGGHPEVLNIFGTGGHIKAAVNHFSVSKSALFTGEDLVFEFGLQLKEKQAHQLRIEYAVYYQKANRSVSKKIFKIREGLYDPGKVYTFRKKHSFKDLTTRKHYPGQHAIAIIVNGNELGKTEFKLRNVR
jgi:3-methyladenine DNA glycosylase AlkC